MLFYNTSKQNRGEDCHSFMRRLIVILLMGLPLLIACLPLNPIPATEPPPPTETPPPSPTVVWFPPSATATLNTIPTYTPIPDMKPGIGSLIFSDNFTDDSIWDTVDSDQASVIIKDHKLILAVEPYIAVTTMRRDVTLSNFYAEFNAQIGLCRGGDAYGLIIRSTGNSFYRFTFTCDGSIRAERIKDSVRLSLLEPIYSGDMPLGPPGVVKMGIWVMGGEMRIFLNDRFQVSVIEKAFPSGAFGLFVQSGSDTPMTMLFSDLKVYAVEYTPQIATPTP